MQATHIAITFQGGFVGTKIAVSVASSAEPSETELRLVGRIYPEDNSRRQVFRIPRRADADQAASGGDGASSDDADASPLTKIKLGFEATSDNQGRIVVYTVELLA